ncbi:PREDICTED: alpha-2A adrenergic receptor-like [Priapulus caudatus]|uniref:Alpha-2A adrenergic receptor-like n=1 Tax=Priapulus caudatus TaxID=37621 RepID=A0ABM1E891_PRICU|nr:PREDICTED: alpha-2A adrenergic receptor-like [Priapulus caudatus]
MAATASHDNTTTLMQRDTLDGLGGELFNSVLYRQFVAQTDVTSAASVSAATLVPLAVDDVTLVDKYFEAGVLVILLVTASLGNTLLWASVLGTRRLRKPANYLVLCLSLADLLVSVINMPFTVSAIVDGRWTHGDGFCVVQGFTNMVTFVASVMSLAAITINRYVAVCYCGDYRAVYTPRNTIFVCIGVWLVSAALAAPPLLGWASYGFLPGQSFCFCLWATSKSYTFFMVFVCFGGPLGVMAYCYAKIIIECKRSRERMNPVAKRKKEVNPTAEMTTYGPGATVAGQPDMTVSGQYTVKQIESIEMTVRPDSGVGDPPDVAAAGDDDPPSAHSPVYFLPAMQPLDVAAYSPRRFAPLFAVEEENEADDSMLDGESCYSESSASRSASHTTGAFTSSTVSIVSDLFNFRLSSGEYAAPSRRGTGMRLAPPTQRLSSVSFQRGREKLRQLGQTLHTPSSVIMKRLRRKKRREKKKLREIHLAKLFLVVICAFVVSWFPFCVTMFWSVFGASPVPRTVDMISLLLGYANSCYNPIIYGALNRNFREGYKNVFGCRRRGRRQTSTRQMQKKMSRKWRKVETVTPKTALPVTCPRITVTSERALSVSVTSEDGLSASFTSDGLSDDGPYCSVDESADGELTDD